ncbi:hypothetical protein [Streptosporangium oxazolinicum]|uniref:hypothetical protein n=1 Tax=Streptosporangium oxazolinicum TaxID=909287 RepID=UPI0031ECAE7C
MKTLFVYFRSKEDLVFADQRFIEAVLAGLAGRPSGTAAHTPARHRARRDHPAGDLPRGPSRDRGAHPRGVGHARRDDARRRRGHRDQVVPGDRLNRVREEPRPP